MERWMIDMRTDYERDLARKRLARYTLVLLALAALILWMVTRC